MATLSKDKKGIHFPAKFKNRNHQRNTLISKHVQKPFPTLSEKAKKTSR